MLPIRSILLLVALVLFVLAALNVGSSRINLTAAGLACFTAASVL